MKILAVDTALGACSAAVLDDDVVLAHRLEAMERGHAERLAPMVQEVMREAGLGFGALDRLGVTTGPGTFTGQRVGLAFMRGMRLALRRPLLGVTTLDCILAAAAGQSGLASAAVLHDARRGEVYCAASRSGQPCLPVSLMQFEDALTQVSAAMGADRFAVAGTAGERGAADLADRGAAAQFVGVLQPDAVWVARLARKLPEPSETPRPLYLRVPDARLPSP